MRTHEAARPIKVDRAEVGRVVDWFIRAMADDAGSAPEEPLGAHSSLATQSMHVTDVAGNRREVIVSFTSSLSASAEWVLGGALGRFTGGTRRSQPVIVVELNGKYPRENFGNPEILRDRLMHLLMHEVTHASDFPTPRAPSQNSGRIPSAEEVDLRAYYNDPREVRAYMRELYEQIAPSVRKLMGGRHGEQWGLGGTVVRVLRHRARWKEMSGHLTRENRNRILKGLVTAFEDEGFGGASRVASRWLAGTRRF